VSGLELALYVYEPPRLVYELAFSRVSDSPRMSDMQTA
jgi:hypothetical protein